MLAPYRSRMLQRWALRTGKRVFHAKCWVDGKKHLYCVVRRHFGNSSMGGEANKQSTEGAKSACRIGSSLSPTEEITQHMEHEYGISPSSIDVSIQRNGENDLFKLSKRWSTFFKCEKDLYDVINKYIKTNKMDYHLHAYLKGILSEEGKGGANVKVRPLQMEEQLKNILTYMMSLFYKQIQDFNIVSHLSERIINLLNGGNSQSDANGDGRPTNETNIGLDKATILTTLQVYNYVNAMNDELFDRLFCVLNKCYVQAAPPGSPLIISDDEIVLMLKSLYIQKFKNHILLDTIVRSLRDAPHLSPYLSVHSFLYLTLLSRMDNDSLCKVNSSIFYGSQMGQLGQRDFSADMFTTNEKAMWENEIEQIIFKAPLSATDCIKLLYGYLVLGENHINWFVMHKLLLQLHEELKDEEKILLLEKENKKVLQMITIVRTYLRYKKRRLYDNLPKGVKRVLKKLQSLYADEEYSKRKDRKFVQKVSWHLIKLRIPHVKNGNKGGIPLDILEKNKKLVWMCFSYHQYYIRTIDLTAETLLQMDLLKAMNYKIAKVHYYQFSRMKARRTRFEYIRMCRYYTLRDRRNYDDEFEGWNLPYINWYHRKNKNVHVSNYFYGYTPVSHMQY
ncbi:hypothetical protein AK88_04258 [Plasmodium fragile]|uniref:RAP domain-containing protein n=1 Tax=Plasmodium fragile TaxID=5857 RepID=A0A0D9QDX4_PLAFR|nr:uncharacterized protein AK88_04258 [Plasmodium fragile]XP_012338367.1 uncharacterized protein AK88_05342 [Plasmodium fragile]KJP85037.1 hypothetical protein AK88_05342 [Plasmodium fragile]KJP86135.1 hypothetical protein AK88_04258 [Plasmodium fragile]